MTIPRPMRSIEVGTLASVLQLLKLPDGTVKVLVEGAQRAQGAQVHRPQPITTRPSAVVLEDVDRREGRGRGAGALGRHRVRELREAQQEGARPKSSASSSQIEDYAKLADTVASHLAVKIPDKQEMLETHVGRRAAGEGARPDGERNLRAAGREAHPHARQAPDGEDPARVLPQRADEGDPEGARRRGRPRRDSPSSKTRSRRPSSPRKPARRPTHELKKLRQMSPMSAEATVVRNYLDWLLSIPWGKKTKVKKDLKARRRRCSTTITSASRRSRSASSSISPCRARQQAERADPVPRRPSRRRQDLARQVDRQGDRPRVRAHVARRRARRGRDPRPPPHLHRLDARQGHPVDEEGEDVQPALPARRDRQDGRGFPRRSVVGAA